MDNITHTLFAATLARTPLGRAGRGATTALILASNAPDVDIVATAGGALKYLEWHRGPTHGPLGILGLGIVTAGLVWVGRSALDRWRVAGQGRVPNAPFGMLAIVSILGVLLHVLMDLPTSYGTRVLSPFDWHWYAFDWMPILDIYLLMALAAGLFFGWGSDAAGRRNVAIVLVFMSANYGVRAAAHERALAIAPRVFGPLLPPRCDLAPARAGLMINRWPHAAPSAPFGPATRCLVEMAAMPDLGSPFRWRLIAQLSNAYEVRGVNLIDTVFRTPAGAGAMWRLTLRYPNQWTPVVVRAAGTRVAQAFLGFSRFAAARSFVDGDGITTVRWTDVRFSAGPRPPGVPSDSIANLFTATVRIAASGPILDAQLGSR
jgi:membrane-bound metal-dependent hydrolase YbcI (DUF457 family)